jgi:L-lysine 2,3-aminomutase
LSAKPSRRVYAGATGLKQAYVDAGISEDLDSDFAERLLNTMVLSFKVSENIFNMIDWEAQKKAFAGERPQDPLFVSYFPKPGTLTEAELTQLRRANEDGHPDEKLRVIGKSILESRNLDPAGQNMNTPTIMIDGKMIKLDFAQHKYNTLLLLVADSCGADCTYCFRLTHITGVKKECTSTERKVFLLREYLKQHPEVRDVLLTGGDGGLMSGLHWKMWIEMLKETNVRTIRIGTRGLTAKPQHFLDEKNGKLIQEVVRDYTQSVHGGAIKLMLHIGHPNEFLRNPVGMKALKALQDAGAHALTQCPIIKDVNDNPETWSAIWKLALQHGITPHYQFLARGDAHQGNDVTIREASKINIRARQLATGIEQSARLSMSTHGGKIGILGTFEKDGHTIYTLVFLRGRSPDWVGRVFFATDLSGDHEQSFWLNDLVPADHLIGLPRNEKFFFEDELDEIFERKMAELME